MVLTSKYFYVIGNPRIGDKFELEIVAIVRKATHFKPHQQVSRVWSRTAAESCDTIYVLPAALNSSSIGCTAFYPCFTKAASCHFERTNHFEIKLRHQTSSWGAEEARRHTSHHVQCFIQETDSTKLMHINTNASDLCPSKCGSLDVFGIVSVTSAVTHIFPNSGLRNMETNPLPQRCSSEGCHCHVRMNGLR